VTTLALLGKLGISMSYCVCWMHAVEMYPTNIRFAAAVYSLSLICSFFIINLLYVSITNYHVNCNVMLHLVYAAFGLLCQMHHKHSTQCDNSVHVIVGDANIQQIYFVSEMTITRVLFSYLKISWW